MLVPLRAICSQGLGHSVMCTALEIPHLCPSLGDGALCTSIGLQNDVFLAVQGHIIKILAFLSSILPPQCTTQLVKLFINFFVFDYCLLSHSADNIMAIDDHSC